MEMIQNQFIFLAVIVLLRCGEVVADFHPGKAQSGHVLSEANFTLESIGLTKNWVTFGHPRTATTVQFMALNAFGWVLCGFENVEVGFAVKEFTTTKMATAVKKGKCLSITKTHKEEAIHDAKKSGLPITYFRTTGDGGVIDPTQENMPSGIEWKYIQDYDDLMKNGLTKQLQAYAKIFHLNRASSDLLSSVESWLDLWDATRICCGAQMSKTWRAHIHDLNGQPISTMAPGTHECQKHNFLQLEKNLTEIEGRIFGSVLTKVGSCDCSLDMTVKDKLAFNAKPYEACKGPLDALTDRPPSATKPKPKPKPRPATAAIEAAGAVS